MPRHLWGNDLLGFTVQGKQSTTTEEGMVAGQASVHSRESARYRVHIVADQEA